LSNAPATSADNIQGVEQFILLADASDKVPNLPKNRSYTDFYLMKKDWDRLGVIHEVLRVRVSYSLPLCRPTRPFLYAGTIKRATNVLSGANAYGVARHPLFRISYQALGIYG
jgi:hypothetical protein